jgi:26S proteasome regulatory subunit N2
VAVGLALVQYGREEAAEGMLEQMARELVRFLQRQPKWPPRARLRLRLCLPRPPTPAQLNRCAPAPPRQPPEQDPILRYGAMYVAGLAYCGTSNNAAIQRLLHFAVSGGCQLAAAAIV